MPAPAGTAVASSLPMSDADPDPPPTIVRRPYFLRPPVQELPPPRADVTRAAITTVILIAVFSYGFYVMVDWDFESGTVRRQLDKATDDLASGARVLNDYARRNGKVMPEGPEQTLSEEFAAYYGELQGGSALAVERGRQLRGDVFSPGRSRSAPLRCVVEGNAWALASRGPDMDWDLDVATLRGDLLNETLSEAARTMAYDPSNGAASSGDLWVTSDGGSSFAAHKDKP